MRATYGFRTASQLNYKDFRKKNPEMKITYLQFKEIIYGFNTMVVEHILETGEKVKLPAGIGEFAINKSKRKKIKIINGVERIALPIDWKKTKEKGKIVYNFNYHTEEYRFKWKWFKRSAKFKYSDMFFFKPTRNNSRLLAHYLKVDEKYQHIYAPWLMR